MNYAIGIDVGATNLKGLAVTVGGRVLAEMSALTERHWKANARELVVRLERRAGQSAAWLGIAAPGLAAEDQRSIVCMPERLPGLEGLVWQQFLKAARPVPVLNDAQAALLGETWRGAALGARNVFLLTLGTGVGGAAMVDGRLLRGHLGRAGHLGHFSLDPAGVRDIVQTPGSLEEAIGECSLMRRSGGKFRSTTDLVRAGRNGDRDARRVWLASVRALAAGIASLINVLDPEIVLIGGGIAQAGPVLFRPLARMLAEFEWRPGGSRVRIKAARLGSRAGAFGAAWNAMNWNNEE